MAKYSHAFLDMIVASCRMLGMRYDPMRDRQTNAQMLESKYGGDAPLMLDRIFSQAYEMKYGNTVIKQEMRNCLDYFGVTKPKNIVTNNPVTIPCFFTTDVCGGMNVTCFEEDIKVGEQVTSPFLQTRSVKVAKKEETWIPLGDGSQDLCMDLSGFVPMDNNQKKAKEFYRLLKETGVAIFLVPDEGQARDGNWYASQTARHMQAAGFTMSKNRYHVLGEQIIAGVKCNRPD